MASVVLGVAVLTSCGSSEPRVTRGEVVGRDYRPSRDWLDIQPVPHTDTHCHQVTTTTTVGHRPVMTSRDVCNTTTTYIYVPVQRHESEKWTLTLKDCQTEESKKCAIGTIAVDQLDWNSVQIGQKYPPVHPTPVASK